jgi:hypothetical protein
VCAASGGGSFCLPRLLILFRPAIQGGEGRRRLTRGRVASSLILKRIHMSVEDSQVPLVFLACRGSEVEDDGSWSCSRACRWMGRLHLGIRELLEFLASSKRCLLTPLSLAKWVATACSALRVARAVASYLGGSSPVAERHFIPPRNQLLLSPVGAGVAPRLNCSSQADSKDSIALLQSCLGCYV